MSQAPGIVNVNPTYLKFHHKSERSDIIYNTH